MIVAVGLNTLQVIFCVFDLDQAPECSGYKGQGWIINGYMGLYIYGMR